MAQPITGGDFADTFYKFGAGPGQAIAKNRDYYAQLADDAAQAKYREGSLANEQARIAESKRQFEIGQDQPTFLELPVEGGRGTQYHRFVRGQDVGTVGDVKPYPISTVGGSAADIKSVYEATGAVTAIDQQIEQLKQARELNKQGFTSGGAFTGPATSAVTGYGGYAEKGLNALGIKTPEGMKSMQEAAAAQDLMMHILTPASLESFKETLLKGGVSNRDVEIAVNNSLADPRLDAPTREKMIDAAITALNAQRANAAAQAQALASRAPGAFVPPAGGGTAPPATDVGTTPPPPPAGGGPPPPPGGAGANRLSASSAAQLQAKVAEINREPDPAKQKAYLDQIRAALTAQGINPAQYGL